MKKLLRIAQFTVLAVFLLIGMLPAASTAGQTVFDHPHINLTLPEGWKIGQVPAGSTKETIGYLQSEKLPGTTIIVLCYRGMMKNYSAIRIAGLNTIAATYPKGQEEIKKTFKIKTNAGRTAKVEVWRGLIDAGGTTVALQTPFGIHKTKHCWLMLMGFAPDASGPQLEKDLITILKTAK